MMGKSEWPSMGAALIVAGHTPKLDEYGCVDDFAYDGDTHNGPMCIVCHEGGCRHCWDGSGFDPCPGQEEVDRQDKEVRRKMYERLKSEFSQ